MGEPTMRDKQGAEYSSAIQRTSIPILKRCLDLGQTGGSHESLELSREIR